MVAVTDTLDVTNGAVNVGNLVAESAVLAAKLVHQVLSKSLVSIEVERYSIDGTGNCPINRNFEALDCGKAVNKFLIKPTH